MKLLLTLDTLLGASFRPVYNETGSEATYVINYVQVWPKLCSICFVIGSDRGIRASGTL